MEILSPLDDYIKELHDRSTSGLTLLEVWDVINALLEIRNNIHIPEFVLDGDAFTKAVKEAKNEE
jgi:hypothetical protein